MYYPPLPQQSLYSRIQARSMGVKLLVVCALAFLMIIPMVFVWAVVLDRTQRAAEVVKQITKHAGGRQTFLGPTLAIPYQVPAERPGENMRSGVYLIFPEQADAFVQTTTTERHRSLFKVPVFTADAKLDANFDLSKATTAAPANSVLDWNRAEMVVGVSDARGAISDATMTVGGNTMTLTPANVAQTISFDAGGNRYLQLTLFGASAVGIAQQGAKFKVESVLRFSGAQRVAVLAYGKTTHLTMQGAWPNPSFDGGFLPVSRNISNQGFHAEWSVPFIARGVPSQGTINSVGGLNATALGVSFVELADPYQSVNRSLKYSPLFLGLVFLSYFIFETTAGKRVHPAQYVLVGIAQMIFYLLLLSLAERIGFGLGFLIGGAATVALLSSNAAWIFVSRLQGVRALVVFSLLYTLIYLLLRLEDNALLVGAIASFLAVAAAMYFTRSIDWYGSLPGAGTVADTAPAAAPGEAK